MPTTVRPIAFYLPQYYPIPENDAAWGKGFTEWTHVRRARPLFPGHRQPRVPGELGYYDLRDASVRAAQAALAREHGIEGFCYWHYWFEGRRVLERPFAEVVASGEPDFPFCLCWANQSWTGIWYGDPDRMILEQTYGGRLDDEAHFAALLPAFRDPRYMRVDGKPLFCVFMPHELPSPATFARRFKDLAQAAGLPGLFLIGFGSQAWNPLDWEFDGVIPHVPQEYTQRLDATDPDAPSREAAPSGGDSPAALPTFYPYPHVVEAAQDMALRACDYPAVIPNWDNTPRSSERGVVFLDEDPAVFGRHVEDAVAKLAARPAEHRLLFIKAWNEWAEGNYLEPDAEHGRAYLETLRDIVDPPPDASGPDRIPPAPLSPGGPPDRRA